MNYRIHVFGYSTDFTFDFRSAVKARAVARRYIRKGYQAFLLRHVYGDNYVVEEEVKE